MEIKDLSFSYEGETPYLIDDLEFKINKGEYLTILGENGSAKSTLIKLLLGILKPIKGSIVSAFKSPAYVPQKKENFNMKFPITLKEMIEVHIKTAGKKKNPEEILDLMGLKNMENSLFGSLSGGQQQRVLIGRALSADPDLLVLDEPLTGIDNSSRRILRDILLKKHKEGLTIISIEHDISFALHNSTHILVMKDSKGELYTREEYLKQIKHEDLDNILYHREVYENA